VTPQQLADDYLGALGQADLGALLALFSPGAMVDSPLYGLMPATEFFPALFGATSESRLTQRGVLAGTGSDGTALVSIWFRYDWRLADGALVTFDVVDVLELAADGRIGALHIVYDTAQAARAAFERQGSGNQEG
jgi:steroid delta-isomerase